MEDENSIIDMPEKYREDLIIFFKSPNKAEAFADYELKFFIEKKLVIIDFDSKYKHYKITDLGRIYCEKEIIRKKKQHTDNLLKWISLILSIFAIIISLFSLIVQVASYRNDLNDTTKVITDTTNALIEATIITGIGIV